jgi:hypothetical protein
MMSAVIVMLIADVLHHLTEESQGWPLPAVVIDRTAANRLGRT